MKQDQLKVPTSVKFLAEQAITKHKETANGESSNLLKVGIDSFTQAPLPRSLKML
jgi:hypothetical protein